MEQEMMTLITYGGNARSSLLMAMKEISNNNFAAAEKLIQDAEQDILKAHQAQHSLLDKELYGEKSEVDLLMVHAQDHLMDALTIHDMTLQILNMQKNNLKMMEELKLSRE